MYACCSSARFALAGVACRFGGQGLGFHIMDFADRPFIFLALIQNCSAQWNIIDRDESTFLLGSGRE